MRQDRGTISVRKPIRCGDPAQSLGPSLRCRTGRPTAPAGPSSPAPAQRLRPAPRPATARRRLRSPGTTPRPRTAPSAPGPARGPTSGSSTHHRLAGCPRTLARCRATSAGPKGPAWVITTCSPVPAHPDRLPCGPGWPRTTRARISCPTVNFAAEMPRLRVSPHL